MISTEETERELLTPSTKASHTSEIKIQSHKKHKFNKKKKEYCVVLPK